MITRSILRTYVYIALFLYVFMGNSVYAQGVRPDSPIGPGFPSLPGGPSNPLVPVVPLPLPNPKNIEYFWASNIIINQGDRTTFHWKVSECANVVLEGVRQPEATLYLPCEGAVEVQPRESSSWILRAFGPNNVPIGIDIVAIQVSPPPPVTPPNPVIEGFWSDYLELDAGSTSNIHWVVQNASFVSLSTEPGVQQAPSGTVTVQPLKTTTYVLEARSATGQVVSSRLTINVISRAPYIRQFWAEQAVLQPGQTTLLGWDIGYCAKAELILDRPVPVPCTGSWTVAPSQTSNYTLVATGFNGELSNQIITINVLAPEIVPSIAYFYADNPSLTPGQAATLIWNVSNCSKVVIPGTNLGEGPCAGSLIVQPAASQVYQLTAYSPNGQRQSTSSLTLNVNQPQLPSPIIDYFYASSSSINWRGKVTLDWKVSFAAKVELISESVQSVSSFGSLQWQLEQSRTFVLRVTGLNGELIERPLSITVGPPSTEDLTKLLLEQMQGRG